METPNWLWQKLVGNAVWEAITLGAGGAAWWAWKNRQKFADKLRLSPEKENISINLPPLTLHTELQPARITVGSERQTLYDIEAPTPSLARRLEELASWYLHVS